MVYPENNPHKTHYKYYNHNLSSLFQYLCITLAIKKLYEFGINIFDDLFILFINSIPVSFLRAESS